MQPIDAANWPAITLPKGTLDHLVEQPCCGYSNGGPPMTEPTALAAMALTARARLH
jgi:hypothetical protein